MFIFVLVECVQNRPRYFAKKLMKSMKGLGTDEETLIRIIASRSEVSEIYCLLFLYHLYQLSHEISRDVQGLC